jgi:hypothetical protein
VYWKFILANSKDMSNIAELTQARSRNLSVIQNLPGSASFTHPMSTDFSAAIEEIKTCVKALRFNWRESIRMRALGYPANVWDTVWSGPVMTIDEDISADRMTVNCVGWLQRLDKRKIRRDINFVYVPGANPPITATGVDDADIIFSLLAEVNGYQADGVTAQRGEYAAGVNSAGFRGSTGNDWYAGYWPMGSKPNLPTWIKQGQKLPNEGVGGATPYAPAMRGKNYQAGQYVGPAISELLGVENGCDIEIDPITREMNIYRRRMTIRPEVIFGFNWGPKNIQQLGRQRDGTAVVNYHLSTGASGSIPKYKDDVDSQLEYGLLEEDAALSDVVDNVNIASGNSPRQSVLWTYSAAEIALRKSVPNVFSVTPFPYTRDGSVPEPFVDYKVGDRVQYTAIWKPRIEVKNQGVRVFGLNVNIDDLGNEKIGQLQFNPGNAS